MAKATQIANPPAAVNEALLSAALQTRVPYTLLAAVAFQESNYDPAAIGKETPMGWRAKGLMQLSPDVMATYGLSENEVFDVNLNALAGAKYLAALYTTIEGGDWNDTLSAYAWGIGNVRKYKRLRRRFPVAVRMYCSSVLANRAWLQDQIKPKGASAYERIRNAIEALAKLNPTVIPIVEHARLFKSFWDSMAGKVIEDIALLDIAPLQAHWREYARLYDAAPITGPGTPPPAAIEPSLWMELLRRAGDQLHLPSGEETTRDKPQSTAIVRAANDQIVLPPSEAAPADSNAGMLVFAGILLFLAISTSRR